MPVILGNVVVSTARATRNAQGVTGPSTAYLTGVEGKMRSLPANAYTKLPPDLALLSIYELVVDPDTDIVEDDYLLTITESDGLTPWPPHLVGLANIKWRVRYIDPTPPLLMPTRCVYIELVRPTGRTHA